MDGAKGIVVVLATIFVVGECFVPFGKRQDIPPDVDSHSYCIERLYPCMDLWHQNPITRGGRIDPHNVVDHIDEICPVYTATADCVRPLMDECIVNSLPHIAPYLAIGDFLCSGRGRSLLTEVQGSLCHTDPTLLRDVQVAIQQCIAERTNPVLDSYLNKCQRRAVEVQCTTEVVTQQCGDALGEVVRELSGRVIAVLPELQCSDEIPQDYLKRSFDVFRKRSLRI